MEIIKRWVTFHLHSIHCTFPSLVLSPDPPDITNANAFSNELSVSHLKLSSGKVI